jgi:cobalt-zinc-cadmium resistance protein CzcA
VFVDTYPPEAWSRKITKEELVVAMEKALEEIPGVQPTFSQPIRDNVLESISQIDGQVVIKVFGDDLDVLRTHAQQVMHTIERIRGVARAFVDRLGELPQSVIEIDRERAARYNLNVLDIQDVIEIGLGGKAATQIWEGEKKFDVVVRLNEPSRSLSKLKDILVTTPDGKYVPLAEVASFKKLGGSMNISRENGTRLSAISGARLFSPSLVVAIDMAPATRPAIPATITLLCVPCAAATPSTRLAVETIRSPLRLNAIAS